MSYAGVPAMSCECRKCIGSPGIGFQCQSCGRLLCRKCMFGAASTPDRAEQQPLLCNFCFPGDNRPWEAAHQLGRKSAKVSLFLSPKSPLSRSSADKLCRLEEPWQLSSPHPLCCSTYRYLRQLLDPSFVFLGTFSLFNFCHVCS